MTNKNLVKTRKEISTIEGEVVVRNPNSPEFLGKLKKSPFKTLVEVGIGVIGSDKKGLLQGMGRILQAAKGKYGCKQLFEELGKLQKEGKIETDEEIAKNPYAMKSLIDLLKIIDDNPEEDKLSAIKAMFFYMLSNKKSGGEVLVYELFEIVKKLSATQILVLKTMYDLTPKIKKEAEESTNVSPSITLKQWLQKIADELGHGMLELVEKDANILVDLKLVSEDIFRSKHLALHPTNFRPSRLGEKLCEVLVNYQSNML